jgi:D-serine deaminase-like pyridoxal phosphate-dependent protein
MDADYARNDPSPPFAQSLFLLKTVMSTPRPGLAVVDAGLKALALDSGMPLVWNRPELTYAGAADEHGRLVGAEGAQAMRGERIRLVPGHCDPTVDCYDWYVGCRGNRVECLWPVAARGGIA